MSDPTGYHDPIDLDARRRHVRAGAPSPDYTNDRSTESLVQEQLRSHEPIARPRFVWALALVIVAGIAAAYLYR